MQTLQCALQHADICHGMQLIRSWESKGMCSKGGSQLKTELSKCGTDPTSESILVLASCATKCTIAEMQDVLLPIGRCPGKTSPDQVPSIWTVYEVLEASSSRANLSATNPYGCSAQCACAQHRCEENVEGQPYKNHWTDR